MKDNLGRGSVRQRPTGQGLMSRAEGEFYKTDMDCLSVLSCKEHSLLPSGKAHPHKLQRAIRQQLRPWSNHHLLSRKRRGERGLDFQCPRPQAK